MLMLLRPDINPDCALIIILYSSRYHESLLFIIFSSTLHIVQVRDIGLNEFNRRETTIGDVEIGACSIIE